MPQALATKPTSKTTKPASANAIPKTMTALVKPAARPGLELREVPVPQIGPRDVLVKVETTSVCGTDLHIYKWDEWAQNRIKPPLGLGHEFAGAVVKVGADCEQAKVGDFVSAESHFTCGNCFECRTGDGHLCEKTVIIGVDCDGAFAQYVRVPERNLWLNDRAKITPEIATLQEPFGNAVHLTSIHNLASQSVAVFGCGPVGLFTIAIAKASGASGIFASDINDYRLNLAKKMGATKVFNAKNGDQADWFIKANEGFPVDISLEVSGAPAAIRDAFKIVRMGGKVTLFGIPSKPVELDIAQSIIFKGITTYGVIGRKIFETWYRTRWLLESGTVDLNPLITHKFPLEDYEKAFQLLASGEAGKIVLYPNGAPKR